MSLKLLDPPEEELKAAVTAFREGCQFVSYRLATESLRPNADALRRATYYSLVGLPSQMRCNVCRVVAGAWKSWYSRGSKGNPPEFRGPMAQYNHGRDWSLFPNLVSIRTLRRRVRLGFKTSGMGLDRLRQATECKGLGGARLIRRKKGWFLDITVKLPDPSILAPVTPIGVDRGILFMAAARAPGARPLMIHGKEVRHNRSRYEQARKRLQWKGTRSARRLLKQMFGREKRFVLNKARVAAKRVCMYALTFRSPVLALENLEGIREDLHCTSLQHGKRYRHLLDTWAYRILERCIVEKAQHWGIPVEFVDPAFTSRTCPRCGDAREENRIGPRFRCRYCGYRNHSDVVGATNLARLWLHQHAGQSRGPADGPNECSVAHLLSGEGR